MHLERGVKAKMTVTEKANLPLLTEARETAMSKLAQQIEKGNALLARDVVSQDALDDVERDTKQWSDYNYELLRRLFNTQEYAMQYKNAYCIVGYSLRERTLSMKKDIFRKGVLVKNNKLKSIAQVIDLIPEFVKPDDDTSLRFGEARKVNSKSVFIVHGHDDASKLSVKTSLKRFNLSQ